LSDGIVETGFLAHALRPVFRMNPLTGSATSSRYVQLVLAGDGVKGLEAAQSRNERLVLTSSPDVTSVALTVM
jgi:hypothetical protein